LDDVFIEVREVLFGLFGSGGTQTLVVLYGELIESNFAGRRRLNQVIFPVFVL
jgi:hypothetical protein